MITEIGITAGRILELLDEVREEMSVQEAVMMLDEDEEMVLMAAGWLARQGIIHVVRRGGIFFLDRKMSRMYQRSIGGAESPAHHSRF